MTSIKAILFDFIGTTVIEKDPSTINRCYVNAFAKFGMDVSLETIREGRGLDKKEMIASVLKAYSKDERLLNQVLGTLENEIEDNLDNFHENEGFAELIAHLKAKKTILGIGTGLPRDSFEKIYAHLGWEKDLFDYTGIAAEMPRGRPHPDMILDMLKKCNLNKEGFLKLGDTVADIQEGKNAGVRTAVILSGTQEEDLLRAAGPDIVVSSLHNLRLNL